MSASWSVSCDACGRSFVVAAEKRRAATEGVIEVGFKCPGCEKWYRSYFTTPDLQRQGVEMSRLVKSYHLKPSRANRRQIERAQRLYREAFQKLQQEMKAADA